MSSTEDENFDIDIDDDSESDDYAPIVKKNTTKPTPKAPAKATLNRKVPAKPKTAKKSVPIDEEDDSDSHKSLGNLSDDNDAGPSKAPAASSNKTKKTASETYTKLSQLEHILKRPDSYIGSIETIVQTMWTYDSQSKRMAHREVKYVPGFLKIVDEILVNAADNKINDPTMDTIKVTIDVDECRISVYNNGRGIPIEIHSKEKIHIPELIFGHLLSSSNYDDDEKKLTGGRNGYGAKLANIYSHEFTVDTADKNSGQKYIQTWANNMSKVGKAKITKNSKKEEYTRVTFKPDLQRFGMDSIDDDTVSLLKKRVYDIAGTVKDVKVFLNDERLKIKSFKQYVDMYLNSAAAEQAEASGGAAQSKPLAIYEQINPRWEIAFSISDGNFQHVSFANSISTIKGGTHVMTIADQVAKGIMSTIVKKNTGAQIKPAQIRNHMWIFVNALIENPTFDSQTKETLTLPASKFGSKPTITEDFLKKVQKSSIIDSVLEWAKTKADQQIKKTDGTKRNRLIGLTKLSDANNAGGKHGSKCTLILTEGDSAKALAVAGLSVVGRDNFGVFPLRGKLLNVRDARHDQIMKNEEIQNIKKIMGLQHNKDYKDVNSLRYGRLMIMTDQDHDGSHIKGLLINFLEHFFPSLLKVPEFLVEFVTPIVRVTKGKQRKDFFTIPEYEQWLEGIPDARKWDSKYYKGLGTSKDSDAVEYFSNMSKHTISFSTMQEEDKDLIELAFSKKKADERKEWLRQFKPGTFLNHDTDEIPYSDFINKELILFSMADNIRSIPSVADGLKPGQRKVIWGCFKRKLKKEIKVAQLVGYISEHAAYHHGEQSLTMTIINLAQDFVGSNNVNLLKPGGQFGTRDRGGKDHASARYTFTEPFPITRNIFHPADDPLLNYLKEDNDIIEPEYYMPILPMVLVNGAEGIGTGWSTTIPCFNPVDIVENIRRLMKGEDLVPMLPWWRGFQGTIKKVAEHRYDVTGVIKKVNDTTVEITELPIHKWTEGFKAQLEEMIGEKSDGVVKDYKEHHANRNIHFIISMAAKDVEKAEEQGLAEFFKLTSKINTSNMICFDLDGKIKRYGSPEEIIEDFYPVRLSYYQKRKDHLASELQLHLEKLTNQARFVQMIVDKEIVVSNRKKSDIVAELRKKQFRPFPKVSKAKAAGETEDVAEADEEEDEEGSDSDFDYLLGLAIWSLTTEKIDKLKQQATDKEAELLALLEVSPIQMWNTDLDNFLAELDRSYVEWKTNAIYGPNGKPIKRRQAVLETRKSVGKKRKVDDDGSEDDFKPIKAKSKAAVPRSRPKAESSKIKTEDGDSEEQARAGPSKKKAISKKVVPKEEPASEVEVIPAAKGRKAAGMKKKIDSDIEMDGDPVPLPKKKPVARKTKVESSSDVEVLDSANAKPASKRKTPDSSNDSEDENAKQTKKQKQVTDFFNKDSSQVTKKATTTRKVSDSKAKSKPAKKKVIDLDEEDLSMSDIPPPPPRQTASRAARGATKKYVEIPSDDDGGGDSLFQDD